MNHKSYQDIKACNFSTLKHLAKSPLHYLYATQNEREDTTGLLKGRATHTLLFEPGEFNNRYAIFDGKRRQGKEWDLFCKINFRKEVLKYEEYTQIFDCVLAIKTHPEVKKILAKGKPEQVITWKDPDTALECKGRVDWFSDEWLIDLKGTPNAEPRAFGSLVARMNWFTQQAMYCDGLNAALEISPANVAIIAAEINPPHDVVVYRLTEDDLQAGREVYQGWLKTVKECRESGVWPGRFNEAQALHLPKYVFDSEDQEDGTGLVIEDPEND